MRRRTKSDYIHINGVASKTGLPRSTIYKLIEMGIFPKFHLSELKYFQREDIELWIRRLIRRSIPKTALPDKQKKQK